ncbi:hypothetical protein ACFC1T_32855 [Kitasatospora sp. NPDC056076]|uniref:hypothetical protein n=1 Tax=unclassified Kitasatospora TaxID=2633591 RepID=UPI0035DF28B1
MSGDLDELALAAATALVSGLMTDSWEAVKRGFAELIGQDGRMDATRARLAEASEPELPQAREAQVGAWSTRLRDALGDDPDVAAGLRALLAEGVAPAAVASAGPVSQKARAGDGGMAVNVGRDVGPEGIIAGGDVRINKRRIAFIPIAPFISVTKSAAAAHPVVATVTTLVVVAGGVSGAVTVWQSGDSPQPSGLSRMVGGWDGTYTCGQGLTGMHLQISAPVKAGTVDVVFSFFPVPANPGVPRGSATYTGTLSGASVRLDPVAWVERPSDYQLINFVGDLPAADGDAYSGTVTGVGCTTFTTRHTTQ